jgi:hypothetical protein
MTTETGILKKCVEAKTMADKGHIKLSNLKGSFPGLYNNCKLVWGVSSAPDSNISKRLAN